MSAKAPASNPSKKIGRFAAVCRRETNSGDGASAVINHAAPTLCIHVPMLEARLATQSARKDDCRSGLQAESTADLLSNVDSINLSNLAI